MFSDVVEWFLGRASDRRQYKRRPGAFHVWFQPIATDVQSKKPGVGVEVSPNGLTFIILENITKEEFSLIVRLRETNIPVRVRRVRADQVAHQGKTWNRYMCEFRGIAADHWDLIVRYVNDEAETDRRKMQNQQPIEQVDDAYRLLPLAMQEKIVNALVSQHKLEPPRDGQIPLLKLFYGGLVKRAGAKPAHRFNVHSRIVINDEMIAYDTRFLVTDEGEITIE